MFFLCFRASYSAPEWIVLIILDGGAIGWFNSSHHVPVIPPKKSGHVSTVSVPAPPFIGLPTFVNTGNDCYINVVFHILDLCHDEIILSLYKQNMTISAIDTKSMTDQDHSIELIRVWLEQYITDVLKKIRNRKNDLALDLPKEELRAHN